MMKLWETGRPVTDGSEATHYKMYKDGKRWVFAWITAFGLFLAGQGVVSAQAAVNTQTDAPDVASDEMAKASNGLASQDSVKLTTSTPSTSRDTSNMDQSSSGVTVAGDKSTTTQIDEGSNHQSTVSQSLEQTSTGNASSTADQHYESSANESPSSAVNKMTPKVAVSQNSKIALVTATMAPKDSVLSVSYSDTTYISKITLWNDTTNKPYTGYGVPYASVLDSITGDYIYTGSAGNTVVYDPSTGQYTYTGVAGTTINDYTLPEPGYKLMNPEALSDNLIGAVNPTVSINWQMPSHDTNITLHFAALADLQVNYIDKNTGKPILITLMPSDWGVPDSGAYLAGDSQAISASKYTVSALDIPGYTLVSEPTISGVTNTVATTTNPYVQLNFYYQLTDQIAAAGVTPNGKAQVIGLNWSAIPGSFTISGVYGEKNRDDNGDVDSKMVNLVQKYATQGYALAGIVGTYENDDYFNYRQAGVWVHFMPNKNVTVNYVDKTGKPLASSMTLSSNINNPDQQNSGVDANNNWQPAGKWQVSALNFNGYELDTTQSKNMVNGTFAPFSQTVTFIYKRTLLPADPNTPDQPVNPTNPGDNHTPLSTSLVVVGNTKVYDNDAKTDPTMYTVLAPSAYTDFVIPTLTAEDFDLSGITSQNVGKYEVKLSTAGIQKIQAANTSYAFSAVDIQNGLLLITPRPVTITGDNSSKAYGTADPTLTATIEGASEGRGLIVGDDLGTITVSRVPGEGVGEYTETVVGASNRNYEIKTVDGTFTITAQPLTLPTDPNTPAQPVNPTDPNNPGKPVNPMNPGDNNPDNTHRGNNNSGNSNSGAKHAKVTTTRVTSGKVSDSLGTLTDRNVSHQAQAELPQTGEGNTRAAMLIGLSGLLIGLGSLFGFRKRHDK